MRVRLSAAARRDLPNIWTFTAKHWDRDQADCCLRQSADSFDGRATGAVKGRACDEIRVGYAKLSVGAHHIYYRSAAAGVIEVIRILHGRMDVDRYL